MDLCILGIIFLNPTDPQITLKFTDSQGEFQFLPSVAPQIPKSTAPGTPLSGDTLQLFDQNLKFRRHCATPIAKFNVRKLHFVLWLDLILPSLIQRC